jgi:two-component system, NtrC family, response regulator AtoC
MKTAVVIIGDESLRGQIAGELENLSVKTRTVATIEEGLQHIEAGGFDLLFTDLCFPDGLGFELLEKGKDEVVTVLVGDAKELGAAQGILRSGVVDFLPTPIQPTVLGSFLGELRASRGPDGTGAGGDIQAESFGSMVGRSAAMQRVFHRVKRLGTSSAPVLITGESGTGKELVARTIHQLSRRRGEFVAVNCGAISPSLMESELFGHERGSFTGATRAHRGFFERAHEGTLFLDEITEMPLDLQVKLLRVLERSRVLRLGAEKHREVNVRVLAATNRPPAKAIQDGKLREDLYYRIRVLHVELPALREREGDIPLLARHFLADVIEREGRTREFSGDTLSALERYHWPGNARELRNAVYTAYLLCGTDAITPEDLPPEVTGDAEREVEAINGPSISLRIGESIDEAERRLILTTLAHVDGNKTQAAEILGISIKTLYNRLHEYGLMGGESE